jgi:hypothetical protein
LKTPAHREVERLNWVAISFLSQFDRDVLERDGFGHLEPVKQATLPGYFRQVGTDYRLPAGPGSDGLTDQFLSNVARAYAAALARDEHPNLSIADQVGYPLKTVQRWVYTARQRGIMPRGERGRPG